MAAPLAAHAADRLAPLAVADFPVVRRLAESIWHAHYDPIVGPAQVDWMLARRSCDEALSAYVGAGDRWFDVLWAGGEPVGYASHALQPEKGVLKLEQLYLRADHRGRGLGRHMLAHVEAHGRTLGRTRLVLQVNKRNETALEFYRRAGFAVREAAVFDIGGGFVMDDFVLEKPLR